MGIYIDCAGYTQNRVIGSYLDFTDLVTVSPEHLLISAGFFLGGGAVRIKATSANRAINGLVIRDNEFDYASNEPAIKLDESEATFDSLLDCVIDGNMLDGSYHALTTKVTRRFAFQYDASATSYCFDLRSALLFPQFNVTSVQVTLHSSDPAVIPAVAVVPGRAESVPAGDQRSVCIATSAVPAGSKAALAVDITADQSRYTVGQQRADGRRGQEQSRHGQRTVRG